MSKQLVRERRYEVLEAPELHTLGADEVHDFLKAHKKYTRLRLRDDLKAIPLMECLSDELREVLETRKMRIPSKSGSDDSAGVVDVLRDDTTLRAYLEEKERLTDVLDIARRFRALTVDARVGDVDQRMGQYAMRFAEVESRCTHMSFQENALRDFYVDGLRPEGLRRYMRELVGIQKVTLQETRELAEDRARMMAAMRTGGQMNADMLSSDVSTQASAEPGESVTVKTEQAQQGETPVAVGGGLDAAEQQRRYELRTQGLCTRCGEKWFPGHRAECKGPKIV